MTVFAEHAALLVVDVQNDFCAGGALAVPGADEVVPVVNRLAAAAAAAGVPVLASRDWHPADSPHFLTQGGLWPVHCVQGTRGAAFHDDLRLPGETLVVTKGDSARDPHGYDAFDGHLDDGMPLGQFLQARGVTSVVVAGLATDYCVKSSVYGACRTGLAVTVVADGIRAVDVQLGDGARALADMLAAGARVVTADDLLAAGS